MVKHWLLILGAVLSSGCGGTIFNQWEPPDTRALMVDARQRMIVSSSFAGFERGQVTPKRIICAEPSPDVATTFASSLGAGVSVFGYGSGSISQAFSQGLAQLGERVATVQLLRDVLYRACEAYGNGAISSTTYTMITARLGQTAATLLLGEMATGAFGRNLAGLGSSTDSMGKAELVQDLKISPAKASAAGQPSAGGSETPPTGSAHGTTDTRAETKTTVTGGGAITGPAHNVEVAAQVARIHRTFIQDNNLDALMLACVTSLSMDTGVGGAEKAAQESSLSHLCRTSLFGQLQKDIPALLKAKADAEATVIRASNEQIWAAAVLKCYEQQAKPAGSADGQKMCGDVLDLYKRVSGPTGRPQ